MYAHQIIDALLEIIISGNEDYYNKHLLTQLIVWIQESQKFYFGSTMDIFRADGEIKFDFIPEYSRPPYLITWLDYDVDESTRNQIRAFGGTNREELIKMGMVVIEKNKKCTLQPFVFADKKWKPLRIGYIYEIDKKDSLYAHDSRIYKNRNLKISDDELWFWQLAFPRMFCVFLRFLSCKNIETQDNLPSLKLNKKRKKTGKQELFTYKTLVIKPIGKKQESQAAQGLWDNRIHLCRGHFKEYTTKKPLFGRITGRFWWQPSVRGRSRDGIVMKNYKIEA